VVTPVSEFTKHLSTVYHHPLSSSLPSGFMH